MRIAQKRKYCCALMLVGVLGIRTPIFIYGEVPDIETFCKIVVEETEAEGVRGKIVFEQVLRS